MVKVVLGEKGSGKTKHLIELCNAAAQNESGNVVCLERGQKLTYDIHHSARLINTDEFAITSAELLRGFICGLCAGDYDLVQVFIDSLQKIVADPAQMDTLLNWLSDFSETQKANFTVAISMEESNASETMKKFL